MKSINYIKPCILRATVLLFITSFAIADNQKTESCTPPPISIEVMGELRGKTVDEVYMMRDLMFKLLSMNACEFSHSMFSVIISDYTSIEKLGEFSNDLDMGIFDQVDLDIVHKILQYVFDHQLVKDSRSHGLAYDILQKIEKKLEFFGEA